MLTACILAAVSYEGLRSSGEQRANERSEFVQSNLGDTCSACLWGLHPTRRRAISSSTFEDTVRLLTASVTLQPVSYISLALTLGTGAGLLWYYSHVRDKKLSGALFMMSTTEVPLKPGACVNSQSPSWRLHKKHKHHRQSGWWHWRRMWQCVLLLPHCMVMSMRSAAVDRNSIGSLMPDTCCRYQGKAGVCWCSGHRRSLSACGSK